MAHFLARVVGSAAGHVQRIGTKKSGITADVNGWSTGVRVVGAVQNGEDVFYVYRTAGSDESETAREPEMVAIITPRGYSVELRGEMVVSR